LPDRSRELEVNLVSQKVSTPTGLAEGIEVIREIPLEYLWVSGDRYSCWVFPHRGEESLVYGDVALFRNGSSNHGRGVFLRNTKKGNVINSRRKSVYSTMRTCVLKFIESSSDSSMFCSLDDLLG
jgi:hypothetical protein